MTKLTFYGGAGEIGGNKILLKDKNAKIFLDFGEPFNFGNDYFGCMYGPRNVNGMEVYFKLGLMPKIEGIYRKDLLQRSTMKYKKPSVDAIFISHCHCDHINHISFIDESIPIYLGHGTLKIIKALKTIGRPKALKPDKHKFKTFKTGEIIRVKHLKITPIHVDHSIPGAYGYIIKTSKGNIVYTGDIRFHGPMAKMSKEFVEEAKKSKPIVLICEGTRVGSEDPVIYRSEEWVRKKIDETIKKTKNLVMGYFSSTNIDRLMSFYSATVKNKRKFVIDYKAAEILHSLKDKIKIPDPQKEKNILVYFRMEKKGEFNKKEYPKYAREYWHKMVNQDYVRKNQDKLVMMLGFHSLIELIYIKPKKNSSFIYSLSEIWLQEDEQMAESAKNWMNLFKIKMIQAHASGHSSESEIKKLIKRINPNIVIPIHTEQPQKFKEFHKKVIIPEVNQSISI